MTTTFDILAEHEDPRVGQLHREMKPVDCTRCWPDGPPVKQKPVSHEPEAGPDRTETAPRTHERGDGFEPLAAAMQRFRSSIRVVDEPADSDQSPLHDGGPADCPTCRGYRWMRQPTASRDDPRFGQLVPCPECFSGFMLQRRIERMWGHVPLGLRGFTLETLQARSAKHAERLVPRLIEWIEAPGAPWLYLHSPSGHGKTGAGVALLHALMLRGQTVAFCFVLDMLSRLRRTYRSREACEEDETDLFAALYAADLVLVDDVGVEHHRAEYGVDWATEKIHQVVEGRYTARQRTIITSNLNLRELTDTLGHERTASRINEMTRGDRWCLDLSGVPNLRAGLR